jgi:hypothetical protein
MVENTAARRRSLAGELTSVKFDASPCPHTPSLDTSQHEITRNPQRGDSNCRSS